MLIQLLTLTRCNLNKKKYVENNLIKKSVKKFK